jgi:shikimate dehydrogenase
VNASKIILSISQNPTRLGMSCYNSIFKELEMKYIYKSLQINDLSGFFETIRGDNFAGFSVSMPYKEKVVSYLDSWTNEVEAIGAVNTVINDNGQLRGHNTDYIAIKKSLSKFQGRNPKILIMGGGGVAKAAIQSTLSIPACEVFIATRLFSTKRLDQYKFIEQISWSRKFDEQFDVIINATPLGMNNFQDFEEVELSKLKKNPLMVIDLPINFSNKTALEKFCIKKSCQYISGLDLYSEHFKAQFFLYTRKNIELDIIKLKIKECLQK